MFKRTLIPFLCLAVFSMAASADPTEIPVDREAKIQKILELGRKNARLKDGDLQLVGQADQIAVTLVEDTTPFASQSAQMGLLKLATQLNVYKYQDRSGTPVWSGLPSYAGRHLLTRDSEILTLEVLAQLVRVAESAKEEGVKGILLLGDLYKKSSNEAIKTAFENVENHWQKVAKKKHVAKQMELLANIRKLKDCKGSLIQKDDAPSFD
jgi:hypothetical protein